MYMYIYIYIYMYVCIYQYGMYNRLFAAQDATDHVGLTALHAAVKVDLTQFFD